MATSTLTPRIEELLPSHGARRKKKKLENVHEDIKLHVVTAYDGTVTAVPHVGEDGKMLDAGLSAPTTPPPAGRARLMRRASVNYGIQDLKKLEEIAKAAEKIHAESGSAGTEATDGDIGAAVAASNSRGRTFKRGFLRKLKKMHSLAERSLWKKRFFLVRDGFLLHYRGEKDPRPTGWLRLDHIRTVKRVPDGTVLPGTHKPVKHCFEIALKSHTLLLRGSSDDDVREWMGALFEARGLKKKESTDEESYDGSNEPGGPTVDEPADAGDSRGDVAAAPAEDRKDDAEAGDGKADADVAVSDGKDGAGDEADAAATGEEHKSAAGDETKDAEGVVGGVDAWEEHWDDHYKASFWMNRETNEMSWAPPDHIAHGHNMRGVEWVVRWDAERGKHYWYRSVDGVRSDVKPTLANVATWSILDRQYGKDVEAGVRAQVSVDAEKGKPAEVADGPADGDKNGLAQLNMAGAGSTFSVGVGGVEGVTHVDHEELSEESDNDDPEAAIRNVPGELSTTWQKHARRAARRQSVLAEMTREREWREKVRAEQEAHEHAVRLNAEVRETREALRRLKSAAERKRLIAELDREHREALGILEEHADDHETLMDKLTKLSVRIRDEHLEAAKVREQWIEVWSVEWGTPYYVNAATNESTWEYPTAEGAEVIQYSAEEHGDLQGVAGGAGAES